MKKYSQITIPKLLKDSIYFAFALFGVLETVMNLMSITLDRVGNFLARLGLLIAIYLILFLLVVFVKYWNSMNEISMKIRGINVTVKQGDIFKSDGWKLIPFNEYFDTRVDDVVIAKSSLNGKYIESLSDNDRKELRRAIADDNKSPLQQYNSPDGARTRYNLGTIKTFRDVMMLALTHFNDQNEAHTNRAEYEQTLRAMWKEIGRVYAGKPITLPLIGAGLTRLDDMAEKPNDELLRCIICTLRTSTVTFNVPITILLTREAMETVNLYELKGVL